MKDDLHWTEKKKGKKEERTRKCCQSECDPTAAQRAIEWVQKFALLLIFLASQKEVEGIESRESNMEEEILQSRI
jgi:hypothetical protein